MRYVFKKRSYILLFSALDALGRVLFFPVRTLRRRTPPELKKILVIRTDHIGDVVAATAVFKPLREKFPGSVIDLMAPSWAVEMLEADPFVDGIIKFDAPWFDREGQGILRHVKALFAMARLIRSGRYDLAIDLRGDARNITAMFLARVRKRIGYGITGAGFLLTHQAAYEGKMHETDRGLALLRPLGIEGPASGAKLRFSQEDDKKAGVLKREAGIEGAYAVLHAVPGHPAKDWNDAGFARVARYLRERKGFIPVTIGADPDKDRVKRIKDLSGVDIVDLSGRTDLGTLGSVVDKAALFMGVDSGPAHIAAASGVPTLILFSGANDPAQWAPRGENVKVIFPGTGKDLSAVPPEEVCRVIDKMV